MAWNVVIAGGGFGGFHTARKLERSLPPHAARITMVTDVNFMLYTPFLPSAAGGHMEPRNVVVPLRKELRHTELRLAHVTGADPERRRLGVRTPSGQDEEVTYDHLVVALGSISRTLPIPGLAEHAVGFKTLAEAIALRNRVLRTLEVAEALEDPSARAEQLTYVFVGAGYAGLEALAELQDFAADVIDSYPRCRIEGMRWLLVEARDRVMPEIPADLAAFASRELTKRGIEIRTNTTIDEVGPTHVRLATGESIPTRTVAWTAGVKAHPVVEHLGLPLDQAGRIRVDRFLQVEGRRREWAIGDAAAVPDPARKGEPCPPTSQHAVRQGRQVGVNVASAIGSGRLRPFRYKTLGVFVDMGRFQAVASTLGFKTRGLPAWILARAYHLSQIPGVGRKLRLLVDSALGLVFARDSSELGQLGHPPRLAEIQASAPRGGAVEHEGDGARVRAS